MALQGLMQSGQLLISGLLRHAAVHHGDVEIVSQLFGGEQRRSNWRTVEQRARKLASLDHKKRDPKQVYAALTDGEEELKKSPYRVLQDWQRYYGGNLLIVLPDAFGTDAFLRDAPDWVADWTGFRPDSAPPIEGGERIIRWWREKGVDPKTKLLIFSDGLDVDTIIETYKHFQGKVRMTFGWGTNLTNDFEDCSPTPTDRLDAISLVCKVTEANGRPVVKLSDNPEKATGDPKEIKRYIRLFGESGRVRQKVWV